MFIVSGKETVRESDPVETSKISLNSLNVTETLSVTLFVVEVLSLIMLLVWTERERDRQTDRQTDRQNSELRTLLPSDRIFRQ